MAGAGVTLSEEEIRGALSSADLQARAMGDELRVRYPKWVEDFEFLAGRDCPKTYLPVIAILLTARSMRGGAELDVLDIQQQTSAKGYSASSIGRLVIPFATEQGIDLRSKSTQVLNNQPFTFKKRITPGMTDRKPVQFARFYEIATSVNNLTRETAQEILALLFHLHRSKPIETKVFTARQMGWNEVVSYFAAWERFTEQNSDNGKVGLVFAASVLELIYGRLAVAMGNNWDPDVTTPGDIQVVDTYGPWLWTEVKQKVVTTGDVQAFIGKVHAVGGTRILYCALANANYRNNLDHTKLKKLASREGLDLTIVESPSELAGLLLSRSPGQPGEVVARMAEVLVRRLVEADVALDVFEKLSDLNSQLFGEA